MRLVYFHPQKLVPQQYKMRKQLLYQKQSYVGLFLQKWPSAEKLQTQGRHDLLCPPETAFALAAAWSDARLEIIENAGHALTEPGVMDAMREAVSILITARNPLPSAS